MERRTLLTVLATAATVPRETLFAAASQCSASGSGTAFENYRFAFFTPEEQALLDQLMELIIPADAHSPGASAARVPAFADLMISTGSDRAKTAWRAGLAAFRNGDAAALLARAASEEEAPATDLGRFFIDLKRMTVDGYYSSQIGIEREMQYVGNQHLTAAPACDHPEHGGK